MSSHLLGTSLKPLRIEIGMPGVRCFKSIEHIVWENVPPLALLTGPNGAGKTQLLEFLAYKLAGFFPPHVDGIGSTDLKIDGDSFEPASVAYVPDIAQRSGAPGAALSDLSRLSSHPLLGSADGDFHTRCKQVRAQKFLGTIRNGSSAPLARTLSDDCTVLLDEIDVAEGLSYVFLAYRLRWLEQLQAGLAEEEIRKKLGPAPWDVVNQTFSAAGFPFRVSSPMDTKILDRYQLLLEHTETHNRLRPMDLSSGEKTILNIVLWLYNAQHHGRFPKLLLLDEPDAHLHPSFTRHFLDVLSGVLVRRHGVRVILTTHSPSTVALAPEDSLHEMRRTAPRISRAPSKEHAVGLLTAGLVTVSASTRHVLVEDDDDVEFFNMLRDVLTDFGPTRDPRAMKPAPTVTFLPASLGAGRTKISGGKSVVSQWLDKLGTPPLSELFLGVIDHDSGNSPTDRIRVLRRYSIENYYLDPFVVFAVLVDQGTAPSVDGVSVPQGQEHLIRTLPAPQLQAIVSAVQAAVEPSTNGRQSSDTQEVSFTNGMKVGYPEWMITHRGHDLLPIYQRVFGGPGILSLPRLQRAFKRVRLVPSELADLMASLQS
jgi:predicted ATPase